ncbi:ABC transporter ATP-binding protein [Clostridium cellulovorans]|uniref:ABC transporter related n=1 Tax=Clostridium cellulovorans (strain ATCC 35296 / DSM 3052 / OCM 3 / 743B) TaxID=573061 RepID=D9SMR0_CLOC7|nr:ABC transporter ATP-binding protein [Clostridium cellulovorans]ADL49845.1 ABC transporter related [Clostridium cellulovorans 743B]
MISINGVSKAFEDKEVLKNVSLKVERGSIFGLIGPNGAGKSTLIRGLTGIYCMDKGTIEIDGQKVFDNAEVKEKIGYVADVNDYFDMQKVKQALKFYTIAHKNFDLEKFHRINAFFKIPLNRRVSKLSKGMKTRLAIMLNVCMKPEVLVLDEPTSGLDPIVKRSVMNLLIDEVAENGTTIFISSHNLGDLERICDSVAIINEGEIKYTNSIENMKQSIKKLQVVFKEEAPKDIRTWSEVCSVSNIGKVYHIVTKEYNEEFLTRLRSYGLLIEEEIDMNLEDMFIYSVGGEEIYGEIF